MNLDDVLERGLAAAAEDYDVPAGGIDRVREQLAPTTAEATGDGARRRSPWHWPPSSPSSGHAWLGIAAAVVLLLIAVPIAIGGHGSGSGETSSLSAPSGEVAGGSVATRDSLKTQGQAGANHSAAQPPVAGPAPYAAPVPVPSQGLPLAAAGSTAGVTAGGAAGIAGSGLAVGNARERAIEPVPVTASRVEKTGELNLQVGKNQVSTTLSRLSDIATSVRGYVSDSSTQESGSAPSGEVTLRVPVNNFELAVHDARSITGTKVLSLQTSGVDVTSRYVDLQARITSLKATRSTFLTILAKATTIGETLAVQQRVTDVQTQIEQLQGQLRVLSSTTSMSSLTVTVDQKTVAIAPRRAHRDNGFVKAVKLSVSRFVRGVEAIVGILGPIALVLLIVVLGWLAARFGYRATRRHLV
jgi:Domain of unknown function (DUF4349)